MITQEMLKELLRYEPETGRFYWRVDRPAGVKAGDPSGYKHRSGYIVVGAQGKKYLAHRLAWFYENGEWPKNQIDHVNLIKDDNRIANLREATQEENSFNRAKKRRGLKGATRHKKAGKWQAAIKLNKKNVHLGLFDSELDAHVAYCDAARKLHGEFWRAT